MPLSDLLRAAPELLLVGVLPGFAAATLLLPGWRWWQRLAGAPGLSAGLAGVLGLLYHDLHVPFRALTVVPVELVLVALATLAWRRRRPAGDADELRSWRDTVVAAAALLAGTATVAAVVAGFGDQLLPTETDAPVHAATAQGIVRSHDIFPVIAEPADQSAWVRPRAGFEAVTAIAAEVGGVPAPRGQLPYATLAALLMPFGLALLGWWATRSWVVAALAPLLAVGLRFPANAIILGEYPYVVDATLIAPLVVAVDRALRGDDARRHAAFVGAAIASIWAVHGLEAGTALVIGAPLWLTTLWRAARGRRASPELRGAPIALPAGAWRRVAIRAALVAGAAGAAALMVTLLTRVPAVPAPVASALAGQSTPEVSVFAASIPHFGWRDGITYIRVFTFPWALTELLALLGIVVAVVTRRLRWALLAWVAVVAATFDIVAGGHLKRFWLDIYPWSSGDRVLAIGYWLLPLLMAQGLCAAWAVVRWAARRKGAELDRGGEIRLATTLAGVIAVASVAVGADHDRSLYRDAISSTAVVSSADLDVLAVMQQALPAGATVLNDGVEDAGQWVAALTDKHQFMSKSYLQGSHADAHLSALAAACQDPEAAARALDGIDAIFVGARRREDSQNRWSVTCLEALPGVRLAAERRDGFGEAALLLVDHPG